MPDGFALWPVADIEPFGHLSLHGELSHAEVGTAVMRIAYCNDMEPGQGDDRPPRPADPLGAFLHGLLTFEDLFAAAWPAGHGHRHGHHVRARLLQRPGGLARLVRDRRRQRPCLLRP